MAVLAVQSSPRCFPARKPVRLNVLLPAEGLDPGVAVQSRALDVAKQPSRNVR